MSSILPHWSYAVSMREIDTEFGEWIEDNYRRLGLTQREFAELIGVSYKTVSAWQNQGTRPRDAWVYEAIGKVFEPLEIDANEVRRRAGRREVTDDVPVRIRSGVVVGGRANITANPRGRSSVSADLTTGHQPIDIRYIPIIGTAAADTLRASWGPGDL